MTAYSQITSSGAGILGKPAPVTALADLDDDDLLASCHDYPRDSPQWSAACDILVRRYAPLVRACARRYCDSPEPLDDLIQVGYVGLLKAIGNYDPSYGRGLRAYAAPCITGELKRHFRDKRWQVRVTRPLQELVLEMRSATEDLVHELGRRPTDDELATRLGAAPDDLREARRAAEGLSALSLDAPVPGVEEGGSFGELLGGEDPGLALATNLEAVARHWPDLPHRERRILLLRYYGNQTQLEIARQLGISQMHVSRLQARALARLRDRLTIDEDLREGDAS